MYDIITIGSATVDVFAKTRASGREIVQHAKHRDVCMHLGSKILIDDLITDTGGGGTNTAVSFSRLGFKTGWLGCLGNDANGKHVFSALRNEHVDILGPTKDGPTGYSMILVGLEHDRTILAYKGVNDDLLTKDIPDLKTNWIYCSSMLGKSWDALVSVVKRARKAGIKIAFNPSSYLASQGVHKLAPVLQGLDVLILNKEEAEALLKSPNSDVSYLLKRLHPHVKLPVITDGPRGAYATDGTSIFRLKPHRMRVVETTGAGDAFASGFVVGQMLGFGIPESLRLGQVQAEAVLQAVGAKNNLATRAQAVAELKRQPHHVEERHL